jgi:hypothetical protein
MPEVCLSKKSGLPTPKLMKRGLPVQMQICRVISTSCAVGPLHSPHFLRPPPPVLASSAVLVFHRPSFLPQQLGGGGAFCKIIFFNLIFLVSELKLIFLYFVHFFVLHVCSYFCIFSSFVFCVL